MRSGSGACDQEGMVSVETVMAVAAACGFETSLCTQRDSAGRFFFGQHDPVHVRAVREVRLGMCVCVCVCVCACV